MLITDLLALSHTPRWVNVRHSPPQTVADHSFRVAVIYLELCSRLRKEPSLRGLTYAIRHDAAESYTGDIPADFKRSIKEEVARAEGELGLALGPPPTDDELRLIKTADRIETYTFIAVNGIGPHADRVKKLLWDELKEVAGCDYSTMKLLVHDIIEEAERN